MEKITYDFDVPVDRRGSGALKWDVKENELPMWIADMDFRAAPEIAAALQARLDHGVFGYGGVPDEWYDAYVGWWKKRHGVLLDRKALIFCTGVVPAISSTVRKLTTPNEKVLIQTPVYNIFYNSILNNGARVSECPLIYRDGAYTVDFDSLEEKLADSQTNLMILCNPHNPVGKIWDRRTLETVGALAGRYRVTVLSDEIHCDIARPGCGYLPFFSVSNVCENNSVTCLAPTKAFNLAGIQTAAVYVPDPYLRHKIERALNTDEVAEPNSFAVPAAVAAFTKGEKWLDAACAYLFENRRIAEEYVKDEIPQLNTVSADATYLLWIDISSLHTGSAAFAAYLREKTGLIVSAGEAYGAAGRSFLRMNLACPKARLLDGLKRLKKGVSSFTETGCGSGKE